MDGGDGDGDGSVVGWYGMGSPVGLAEAIKKCHSAIPLTIAILTVPGIRVQCSD